MTPVIEPGPWDAYKVKVNDYRRNFQTGQVGAPIQQTGSGSAESPRPPIGKTLREFFTNPRIRALIAADDKVVDWTQLEGFIGELDYIDEVCNFTKTMALDKLSALRQVLANKRSRPGKAEWITMSGSEADQWVKDLRKCIAVFGQ